AAGRAGVAAQGPPRLRPRLPRACPPLRRTPPGAGRPGRLRGGARVMTLLARAPGRHDSPPPEVTVTDVGPLVVGRNVAEAMALANAYLKDRQEPDGWWKGELETNVTMDAEDVLLRHF